MLGSALSSAVPRRTITKRPSTRAAAALAVAVIALIAAVVLLSSTSAQPAAHAPESIFQDDDHLLYSSTATVAHTLDVLKALGVDRVRLTIVWADVAPSAASRTEPANFDAADPAAYQSSAFGGSPSAWGPYDRVVALAQARGIRVDFNVTAPAPLWAVQPVPASAQSRTHPGLYEPSATAFGQFVQALGTRYSGSYVPPTSSSSPTLVLLPSLTSTATTKAGRPLPRVDFWSIWNEPNQPGWLAPQWRSVGAQQVPNSPRLYRALVREAVKALAATGHSFSTDTILVGETAPEGNVIPVNGSHPQRYVSATAVEDAMTPMEFLRALYCVDSSYRPLTGASAAALGCPRSGSTHSFVTANPGLFQATGFAHHPYFFNLAPGRSSPIPDYVPLADLGRLERGLDHAFSVYGIDRRIPIYLTEYGYQTNPPDPSQIVSPAQQAAYLNQADYMAWRDPRVRSMAQFLLYDVGPDLAYPPSSFQYWGSTFQTGLIYGPGTPLDGRSKPAYTAYALPIWIPAPRSRGSKLLIWGMLRLAPKGTARKALIQWQPAAHRGYATIATVDVPTAAVDGYFTTSIKSPGNGSIRIAWHSATGAMFTSRAVGVGTASANAGGTESTSAGGSAFARVQSAFFASASQTIPVCEFSPSDLQQAQSSVPNDEQQYDQSLIAAIQQARQEQAVGGCPKRRPLGPTPAATTTPASTPVPPPVAPLGSDTPLQIGSGTAATDSGLPAPIAILIVLSALVALPLAALGVARLLGWDPARLVRLRHSWAEAGYRLSSLWLAVGDRIRRGG